MKRNAIVRIILYSLSILILLGFLLAGLKIGNLAFHIGSDSGIVVENEVSLDAADVSKLEIDWAAGSIQITTADTDKITFIETCAETDPKMTYQISGGTLQLNYGRAAVVGFGNVSEKRLSITVPTDWTCQNLEIDAAAVYIKMVDITVHELEMDGSANELDFRGALGSLDIDGASNQASIVSTGKPSQVSMDGAYCQLTLTLPANCGFQAELEGLSCDFTSTLAYTSEGGLYCRGDRYCKVDVDGISCEVTINEAAS